MSLREYQHKRDFKRTAEPAARKPVATKAEARPIFVVQKHAARRLHYDFRLEMDGVLKSWAVPKGFPMKRGERRLAVQVEDHPLEYANFEGTIPQGNYGAGTVMVWDRGTYQVVDDDPAQALKNGKLHLTLAGKKLKGDWTLVRMRPGEKSGKAQWLILKSGDDQPSISARVEDQSALTKRSLKQIASGRSRQWKCNRQVTTRSRTKVKASEASPCAPAGIKKLPRAKAEFVPPMKCELVKELPKGPEWIYEIKFDGVRALAVKTSRGVSIVSRSAKDLTGKYPPVTEALRKLPCREAVLDGEIVAVDAQGRSEFQLLQAYHMPGREKPPILYYVFDLPNLNGHDLTGLPLEKRKEMLKDLVAAIPETVRLSASIEADSERVIKAMKARGLEGLIAKRRDWKYEPGRRSGAWVKFKWSHEQEFVVGGYTEPKGTRPYFGAILVGYYEGDKLMFASKVGTGFDRALLESLYQKFKKLERPNCPFANLPTRRSGDGSLGITAAGMKLCTWLEPRLVAQIRFSEWTRDIHLRQPVFLGLRDDKNPREVVRETPK
ncbi:MAG TPA: non-homologous end-joining DNA ligase [Verrucomicrobiae bacterium]|nr:non-homologous end-joining DNA ligase [Verrucomicrobiae bacterium]